MKKAKSFIRHVIISADVISVMRAIVGAVI
jgi:hypothetical protein